MDQLLWITILGSRGRRFANDFHEWRSHVWKSLVNRLMSDSKIVIHGNECIILFLRNFMSLAHNFSKSYHQSLMSQLSSRTVFSDLALWRHHSWSVTSREREILALWRNIRRLFLHAQIGAKAIFTKGIDTNIEVIVVSLTTWEAHHSPRAKPEGCGELPRSLMRQQRPKLRYQFLFYHDETKLIMNKQILST